METTPSPSLVSGRSCEGCALCCKLPEIQALNKPKDQWCDHCSTRQKCDIYDNRPQACRHFYCGWMTIPDIGDEWRPIASRMMITHSPDGEHLFVLVDSARPDAWRRKPYYAQLKQWAQLNNPRGQQIVVVTAGKHIVIFPDRDEDLGQVTAHEAVTFTVVQTATGPLTTAHKTTRV